MADRLSWGILATGYIAEVFAKAVAESRTGKAVAVGSRSLAKAEAFGEKHGVPKRHGTYEALLADENVEVVYIATPHPMHAEWAIKAAAAGKHVLCEKPIGMNHAEAMAIVDAAKQHDVFLMEAFVCRCHPQTAKLVELIREKVIGEVRLIQASLGFHAPFDPEHRLLNNAMGGGSILDVGCYCVSMARLIAGVAQGKDFADPLEATGAGHIGETTRVDEWVVATMKFPGGILADLSAGVQLQLDNALRIYGTEGYIHVPDPWLPGAEGTPVRLFLHKRHDNTPEEILVEAPAGPYSIEIDTVAEHIAGRQAAAPAMTWADSLGNMKALDLWRERINMVYNSEKLESVH